MLKHRAGWGRWLAGIAAVLLALAIVWVLFVPAADWLAHHDVGSARGPLLQTARDDARGRLLTVCAGLIAVGALWFTARTFALSREGQVTNRYTKAITQLGSKKLDVRIGGIYALERVARDSARDHPTVMEVLTAFIREHSREQGPPSDPGGQEQARPTPRADIQAAAAVIGRRDQRRDIQRIDLTDANLSGAHLSGATLTGATLTRADLSGATLTRADLSGAYLTRADLVGANLAGAHLTRAILASANLSGAHLSDAHLTGANLSGARLADARLTGAHLTRAYLGGANLGGANLGGADLRGADLSGADLTGANLTGARWPENEPVPPRWKPGPGSGRLEWAGTDSGPPEVG